MFIESEKVLRKYEKKIQFNRNLLTGVCESGLQQFTYYGNQPS